MIVIKQTKKGEIFEGELLKYRKLRHMKTWEEVRTLTTIGSKNTLGRYLKDPERMPIGSLIEIMEALKIPEEQRKVLILDLYKIKGET